jgi:hypothetical protein
VVNGNKLHFTKGSLFLDKSRDLTFVTFNKKGFYSSTIAFNSEINPVWPVADLIWLVAAPIAWLIDWQTGSIYKTEPADIHVVLREQEVRVQ